MSAAINSIWRNGKNGKESENMSKRKYRNESNGEIENEISQRKENDENIKNEIEVIMAKENERNNRNEIMASVSNGGAKANMAAMAIIIMASAMAKAKIMASGG
jgi:protein subunit release factor A